MKQLLTGKYTQLCILKGIDTWDMLVEYIYQLPYQRTSNRDDISLVIKEGCGTCSGKHALLKAIADENDFKEVDLHLALFKLNAINMPCLNSYLQSINKLYILEAHCYLTVNGKAVDATGSLFDFTKIEPFIVENQIVDYKELSTYKPKYHKECVKSYCDNHSPKLSFGNIWGEREECIEIMKRAACSEK